MYLPGLCALGWVGSVDVRSIYPEIFFSTDDFFCHELREYICQVSTTICVTLLPEYRHMLLCKTDARSSNSLKFMEFSISKNIMHSTDFCDFLWLDLPLGLPPQIIFV